MGRVEGLTNFAAPSNNGLHEYVIQTLTTFLTVVMATTGGTCSFSFPWTPAGTNLHRRSSIMTAAVEALAAS